MTREEQEARQRALEYVRWRVLKTSERSFLGMPVEDKRKLFMAAVKSITLDGYGRGLWRQ
jgi:hypothetical protein